MTRIQVLIGVLVGLLVVVLFVFLAFLPQREQLAEVEASIDQELAQQQQLESEIARLRDVRENAPRIEADLAVARAVVPDAPALPAVLRQLQLAADESGLELSSVTATRPSELDGGPAGLSSIDVNLQLSGSYFQLIDFLRRSEEPGITPRGIGWTTGTLSRVEHPELTINLSGTMYAVIAQPVEFGAPEEPEDIEPDGPDVEGGPPDAEDDQ